MSKKPTTNPKKLRVTRQREAFRVHVIIDEVQDLSAEDCNRYAKDAAQRVPLSTVSTKTTNKSLFDTEEPVVANKVKILSYREAARMAKKKGWTIRSASTGTKVVFTSPTGAEYAASRVRSNVPLNLSKALTDE